MYDPKQFVDESGGLDFLAKIFEQAPGFIALLTGPDHVCKLTNAAFVELVGHRQILGLPLREAMPEIVSQGFAELLDGVYRTGVAYTGHSVPISLWRTKESFPQPRFIDYVYQPIRNSEGIVTGIFVQGTDVTERVIAEEELRNSEWMLRDMTESLPVAVAIVDRFCVYRLVNQSFCKIIGSSSDEIIGRHAREIMGEEAFAKRHAQIDRVLAGEMIDYGIDVPSPYGGNRRYTVQYLPRRSKDEVIGFYITAFETAVFSTATASAAPEPVRH